MYAGPEDENYDLIPLDELIWSTAKRTCNDFLDQDPYCIYQELWNVVSEKAYEVSVHTPGIRNFLWKQAKGIAFRQRKEDLQNTAQYSYRVSDVRIILETVFDITDWKTGFTPRDARVPERDPMAFAEVRADVMEGFKALSVEQQWIILDRYKSPEHVPARGSKTEKFLNRSVRELTTRMNTCKGKM